MVNLDRGVKLDDSWSSYTPSLDWFKWTTNQHKYIFQIALKCERRKKKFFLNKKRKRYRVGPVFQARAGGDDHQFFFMWPKGACPTRLSLITYTVQLKHWPVWPENRSYKKTGQYYIMYMYPYYMYNVTLTATTTRHMQLSSISPATPSIILMTYMYALNDW
jgi:hypothetical protein